MLALQMSCRAIEQQLKSNETLLYIFITSDKSQAHLNLFDSSSGDNENELYIVMVEIIKSG